MRDFPRRVVRPKRSHFGIFAYLPRFTMNHHEPLPTMLPNMRVWWDP